MARTGRTEEVRTEGVLKKLPRTLRGLVRARSSVADPLKDFVRRITGGKRTIYAVLLACADDKDAAKLVEAWDQIANKGQGGHQGNVQIADVLEDAEVTTREFVGIVTRCAYDLNIEAAKGIFAMGYPRAMAASMRRAADLDATDERKILHTISGLLPTTKGIQIGIQQNNVPAINHEPEPGEAPSVGRTARRLVRDLPPAR